LARRVFTHTTNKLSSGTQFDQSTGHIGWRTTRQGRPGLHLIILDPYLVSQEIEQNFT
jgi:hypothetical protein